MDVIPALFKLPRGEGELLKEYRDEVERYELVSHGREVIVELYAPVGSDNVDAYKTMITSLKIA